MSKEPTALRVTYAGRVMTVQAGTVGNPGNRKYKNESALWFALKKELNTRHAAPDGEPFDLVKRIMSKDGHMVGGNEGPYYLRDRKRRFCIYDSSYALRDIAHELHKTGVVVLTIESLVTGVTQKERYAFDAKAAAAHLTNTLLT